MTGKQYRVPPFSGKNYRKNADRVGNLDPCAICGKGVAEPWPHTAVVINGGSAWGNTTSPEDAGHMGAWPVGSDCHRKYVVTPAPKTYTFLSQACLQMVHDMCDVRRCECACHHD